MIVRPAGEGIGSMAAASSGFPCHTDPAPEVLTAGLREDAHALGFDLVGVTGVEALPEERERAWAAHAAGYLEGMAWLTPERLDLASDPGRLLPEARSLVALGCSYLCDGPTDETRPGEPHGRMARYAWGDDYHEVLKARVRELVGCLSARCGRPVRARGFVDDSPLLERAVAERAGLGFLGKHGLIINPQFGSWLLLAEILVDVALVPDPPATRRCGRCTACIDACPTGAIVRPYVLNATRCISFQTIEQKGAIPRSLRPLLGNHVFGCDICQEVCPWNRRPRPTNHAEFRPRPTSGSSPSLLELLSLDDEGFRVRFRHSPVRRAKRRGLLRNACVALGNLGDPVAVPALAAALRDPEPLVRAHAAWALGRIATAEARAALEEALATEGDPAVIEEIRLALAESGPGG